MVFEYSVGLDEIEDERTHRSASAVLGSLSLHVGLKVRAK